MRIKRLSKATNMAGNNSEFAAKPGRRAELLSPAGDMERLVMAVTYGADAVYLAGTRFGMRASAGNFTDEEMEKAAKLCCRHGIKVYVACNTSARPTCGTAGFSSGFRA